MRKDKFIFSSESVTEGHPDKIADQISDAVLDAILKEDKGGRVACETLVTTGMVLIAGEITTDAYADMPAIVRGVVKSIGYDDSAMGFDWETCAVIASIDRQSPDIAMGVNGKEDMGAGDQGIMFGYAINETPTLMPTPIYYAHLLSRRLAEVRRDGTLPWLRPDGKSQVSVRYENGRPVHFDAVVVSSQHTADVSIKEVREGIEEEVIKKVCPEGMVTSDTKIYVNPTGRFVLGGPMADCGLTGRKIIVDSYGGWSRHGGGAFSGKDPSKVDRSSSYMARYVAKNIVAAGLADECEVQLAYAIGVPEPVSVFVETFGTGKVPEEKLVQAVREVFPLRPSGIIKKLDLLRPIYRKTAAYGHFGREEPEFTWERTDMVDELKRVVS